MLWRLVDVELALWRAHRRVPTLWWRDDDAEADGPALRRLLCLARLHGAPLTLAVVPRQAGDWLHHVLADHPQVDVAQHGVCHRNVMPQGEPPAEFPPQAGPELLAPELAAAAGRLAGLPAWLPLFVPPWDRLTPALLEALDAAGFAAVSSRHGHAPALDRLPRLDVHLDLLRWGGGARFRGEARFLLRLLRLLRQRRTGRAWAEPIGLLTHHLVHDAPAWEFLDRFLARAGGRFAWTSSRRMMAERLAGKQAPHLPLATPGRIADALSAPAPHDRDDGARPALGRKAAVAGAAEARRAAGAGGVGQGIPRGHL